MYVYEKLVFASSVHENTLILNSRRTAVISSETTTNAFLNILLCNHVWQCVVDAHAYHMDGRRSRNKWRTALPL